MQGFVIECMEKICDLQFEITGLKEDVTIDTNIYKHNINLPKNELIPGGMFDLDEDICIIEGSDAEPIKSNAVFHLLRHLKLQYKNVEDYRRTYWFAGIEEIEPNKYKIEWNS